jgi:hypothetical protein
MSIYGMSRRERNVWRDRGVDGYSVNFLCI